MSSSDPTRVKSNYIPHILRYYGKSNAAMGMHTYFRRHISLIMYRQLFLFIDHFVSSLYSNEDVCQWRESFNNGYIICVRTYARHVYLYIGTDTATSTGTATVAGAAAATSTDGYIPIFRQLIIPTAQ